MEDKASKSPIKLAYSSSIVLFDKDKWHGSELGFSKEQLGSGDATLSYKAYKISWLKSLAKETVWRKRVSVKFNTLQSYVKVLKSLDRLLDLNLATFSSANDLTREAIESYLVHISKKSTATRKAYISQLTEVFNCWNEWGFLTTPFYRLIHRDDKPRNDIYRNPRFMSVQVQSDLSTAINDIGAVFDENPDRFPLALTRVSAVLQETGMRGNEALHLKKNCLSQDPDGDWHLTRIDSKVGSREHTVPITHKLHAVILEQLQETKDLERQAKSLGYETNSEDYLFIHLWSRKAKPYTLRYYNKFLKELVAKIGLKDVLGIEQNLSSHAFRHTVGTNLINSGVAQHLVQKYLGHASPNMTAVYAFIHDETLKNAIVSSANELVDIKGKFYDAIGVLCEMDVVPDKSASLDSQWLKRNIATQTLPNGVCALPARQGCPHANKCLTCNSFRTDGSYLPVHKEQLELPPIF